MTTPGKNFPALPAFLPTPDSIPETSACRTFSVPDNDDWLGLLMGALNILSQEWAYFPWGEVSIEDTAAKWNDIINQAYADSIVPGECDVVSAPYWDDADAADADDTSPAPEEPWYGEVEFVDDELTFSENLQIWVIAGFVMLAASPLAAVTFIPIAQRFTLAFKKHDLGGIIRAFVNGIEVNQADSYAASPGVGTMSIAIPPPAGFVAFDAPNVLTLVMSSDVNPAVTGTPNIQLFRQRLSEADFSPPFARYNPDTDTVQITPDDGVTWNDSPENDPRHSTALRLPVRTGTDVRCDSAANAVKWIHDFIDALIAAGAEASQILLVVNLLLKFLELLTGWFSVILDLIVEAAGTIATLGSAALEAAFTSDQYDLLLCIFDCRMDADGLVTASALSQVETDVSAQLNATAASVVNLILELQGETGLTNAGRIGAETGDCSGCDCGWCFEFDLTVDDAGIARISGCPYGTWVSGTGWRSDVVTTADSICTEMTFTSAHITSIELTTNWPTTPSGSGAQNYCQWLNGSTPVHTFTQTPSVAFANPAFLMEFDATINHLIFNPSGFVGTGVHFAETHLKFRGLGDCPFGTPNCE